MRRTAIVISTLVLATVVLGAAVGCGDGSGGDGGHRSATGAPASATPTPTGTEIESTATGVMSASTAYEADLGGVYQAVGFEIEEEATGGVCIAYVSSPEVGKAVPTVHLQRGPGWLDVFMSDTRRHADLATVVKASTGPIRSGRFIAPPDDSLCVLRLTLRASAAPGADVSETWRNGAGVIEVKLGE